MKGFTKRAWCALCAIPYFIGAIGCVTGSFAVMIFTELSHGAKSFLVLTFGIMAIVLGYVGFENLRRVWRKNGQGEDEDNG